MGIGQTLNRGGAGARVLPRRRFRTRLDRGVAAAEAGQRHLVVLVVELDRFDLVTNGLGRAAGHDLLRAVADRVATALPEGSFVTALDANRFALMPADVGWSATRYAEAVLDSLAEPFTLADFEIATSASVGIGCFPADGTDADSLLDSADRASAQVKQQGGNGILEHEPTMRTSAIDRLELEAALRGALDGGELWVAYQPRVDVTTNEIRAAEALVRWNHPVLGSISPADFIPIAEETGLIGRIGEWVLDTACRQALAWDERGLAPVTVAVNVSPRQFELGSVGHMVTQALETTGLAPERLELELTESVDLLDPDAVSATLADLRRLGVQCAIDDFGTGYSCLSHLTSMPIAALKIDRAFTRAIGDDPAGSPNATVVITVLELARRLDLLVVAEGVENHRQLEFLRRHGCSQAQGFLFSRPLPPDLFEALVRRHRGGLADVIDLRTARPAAARR